MRARAALAHPQVHGQVEGEAAAEKQGARQHHHPVAGELDVSIAVGAVGHRVPQAGKHPARTVRVCRVEHLPAQAAFVEPAVEELVGVLAAELQPHRRRPQEVPRVDDHCRAAAGPQHVRHLLGEGERVRGWWPVEREPHPAGTGGDELHDLVDEPVRRDRCDLHRAYCR